MSANIGKLAKVNLREICKNEEYDSSNWLAVDENVVQLSDESGVPIACKFLLRRTVIGVSLSIASEEVQ